MKFLILLFFLSINQFASAQRYLMNKEDDLKKNKVKTITVKNCLGSVCLQDWYTIDKNGNVIEEASYPMSMVTRTIYDDKNRIDKVINLDYDGEDSIYSTEVYHYAKFTNRFRYRVTYPGECLEYCMGDTSFVLSEERKKENIKTDDLWRIIEHTCENIGFPCGYEFQGTSKFTYIYDENGLLKSGEIHHLDKLIVSLSYEYTFY